MAIDQKPPNKFEGIGTYVKRLNMPVSECLTVRLASRRFGHMKTVLLMLAILGCLTLPSIAQVAADRQPDLWIYCPTNLQVDANIDKLEALWTRASKAGYTRVMLADSKFGHLSDVPDHYFKNCARVKQIAERLHLQIVPAVFPIGYSNDLLEN